MSSTTRLAGLTRRANVVAGAGQGGEVLRDRHELAEAEAAAAGPEEGWRGGAREAGGQLFEGADTAFCEDAGDVAEIDLLAGEHAAGLDEEGLGVMAPSAQHVGGADEGAPCGEQIGNAGAR